MAKTQQQESNTGTTPHAESSVPDQLMKTIPLYDAVEIRFVGLKLILNDLWHGLEPDHPYYEKLLSDPGFAHRRPVAESYTGVRQVWTLKEWLFVWIVHSITGSGINFAERCGYYNSILPYLHECEDLQDLTAKTREILASDTPAYSPLGYQFPRFPSPPSDYKRGGDFFICEHLPIMVEELAKYIQFSNQPRPMRAIIDWMNDWNESNGLQHFRFQYHLAASNVAIFFPELADHSGHVYYGSNSKECLRLMGGGEKIPSLDYQAARFAEATGGLHYDLEEFFCDSIRWIENYIPFTGADSANPWSHVDRDQVWNSCTISDHPKGRQRNMLRMGLVDTFNGRKHPSDYRILKEASLDAHEYRAMCNQTLRDLGAVE